MLNVLKRIQKQFSDLNKKFVQLNFHFKFLALEEIVLLKVPGDFFTSISMILGSAYISEDSEKTLKKYQTNKFPKNKMSNVYS